MQHHGCTGDRFAKSKTMGINPHPLKVVDVEHFDAPVLVQGIEHHVDV
jgi:hypothetical protein